MQNNKITIRHLLTSTSGLPDYHHLGDPLTGQAYQPKALDEVIDLFENKPFTMKPGMKYDWSISNFALLVSILQKVTNQRYEDYLRTNIIAPLGMQETEYLTQKKLIPQFAQGYHFSDSSFYPATESIEIRSFHTGGEHYRRYVQTFGRSETGQSHQQAKLYADDKQGRSGKKQFRKLWLYDFDS